MERLQQLGLKFAALFERSFWQNIKQYTGAVKGATKATVDGAAKMQASFKTAFDEAVKRTGSVSEGYFAMAQAMQRAGVSHDKIVEAVGRSTASMLQYDVSVKKATGALDDLDDGTKKTGDTIRRSSSYLARYLKRLALWVTVGMAVRTAIRLVTRGTKEFVKAVVEGTEEADRLSAAQVRVKESLVGAFAPEVLRLADRFADAMDSIANAIERAAVNMEIWRRVNDAAAEAGDKHAQMLLAQGVAAGAVVKTHDSLSESLLDEDSALAAVNQRIEEYRQRQAEIEKESQMERAINSMIDAARRFDKEMARHAEKVAEINQIYQVSMLAAGADYYREAEQIALNEQEKIAEINSDALDRRESALKKFQNRINQLEQRGASQRQANAERHALQMEFAQRRHDLAMMQSERRYQSSRSRLVAEGDTIAIEELDERHRIEEAEREENFRLQQQQAEAMFQLQQRLQEEANRQQVALMRQALMEQLRLIEEQRQERVEEAQETADEERAEAADAAADRLTDAKAAQIEALAEEEKAHQERVAALGEFLRKFADDNELGLDEVLRIWQSRYGTGGPIDNAIRTAFQQYTGYVNAFIRSIQQALVGVRGLGGGLPGRPSRGGTPTGHQYGGDIIAGRPTQFTAGEGNVPEIVQVRPISPIGGAGQGNAMTHRWGGGAIPVHGTGSLEGMDLSDLGDAIGAGLMSEMRRQGAARVGSMH